MPGDFTRAIRRTDAEEIRSTATHCVQIFEFNAVFFADIHKGGVAAAVIPKPARTPVRRQT